MHLTVMTFNIQHGVDHARRLREPQASDVDLIDLDRIARIVQLYKPDVLSLNEVRDSSFEPGFFPQTRFLSEILHMPYYYFGEALGPGERGPYGNSLLSRLPMEDVQKIMIPDPPRTRRNGHYETRCLIKARILTDPSAKDGGPFCVMNTHFGLEPEEAENAVKTVLEQTPEEPVPTIVMGDFNLVPSSPILQPLLEVYQDSGALLPNNTLTYPSNDPEIKIDYILGRNLTFTKATVPDLLISDHKPYIAEIDLSYV